MRMLGILGMAALFAADAQAQDRGFQRGPQARPGQQAGGQVAGGQGQAWKLLEGKYDKNKDGRITAEEYPREASKFKSFDRDGDGVISAKDFESGGRRGNRGNRQRGNRQQMMQRFAIMILVSPADADKDGTVTQKEWKAHLDGLASKDGGVDMEKLAKNMPRMGRRGNRRGGRPQGGQQGREPGQVSERQLQFIARLFDTDQDGEVTLSELTVWFAKVDKNQDGILGKDELPAQRQRGRQGNQAGSGAPVAGQVAPDFELPWLKDKKKTVRLSSFRGKKPVALIFGSYT